MPNLTKEQIKKLNEWARTQPGLRGVFPYTEARNVRTEGLGTRLSEYGGVIRGEAFYTDGDGEVATQSWSNGQYRRLDDASPISAQAFYVQSGGELSVRGLVVPIGSKPAPSISFVGDSDTGLYSPHHNHLHIASGGSDRLDVSGEGVRVHGRLHTDTFYLTGFGELHDFTYDYFLGSTLHDTSVSVTSNGTTVTVSYSGETTTSDIRLLFGAGVQTFQGPITATLTPGTDASPTLNYVYILASAPSTLVVSTTGFPAESIEYCPVAQVLCQSAAGVQSYGAYKVHSWNDHAHSANPAGHGHIGHINAWIRTQPATWISGVSLTPTINTAPTPDTVSLACSSGVVLQLHRNSWPSFADGTGFFVVNHPTAAYTRVTTMPGLDSNGNAIGNGNRISVVVWGSINSNSSDCKLFMNLPSGYYQTDAAAIADDSDYTNFTIPSTFTGTGFLISNLIYSYSNTNGGSYTLVKHTDLRGLFPSVAGGGASASQTEFLDSTFRVNDNTDQTKELAFEVSGVTTGTVRTLTVPDKSGTISVMSSVKDGTNTHTSPTALNFNNSDFYLSVNNNGNPVVNILQNYANKNAQWNTFDNGITAEAFYVPNAGELSRDNTTGYATVIGTTGAALSGPGTTATRSIIAASATGVAAQALNGGTLNFTASNANVTLSALGTSGNVSIAAPSQIQLLVGNINQDNYIRIGKDGTKIGNKVKSDGFYLISGGELGLKDWRATAYDQVISNSNAETTIFSATVPGGLLGSDGVLDYQMNGNTYNFTGVSHNIRYAIYWGGIKRVDVNGSGLGSVDRMRPKQVKFRIAACGSDQAQFIAGTDHDGIGSNQAVTGIAAAIGGAEIYFNSQNKTTVDSSVDQTLQVTATLTGTASAAWSFYVRDQEARIQR